MTRPAVIFFGPDSGSSGLPKVFLRTLLYSTGKRGIIIEQLFIKLRRGETQQNFPIWVYGNRELSRGSGLYVNQDGISADHHFLPPVDMEDFRFLPGNYEVRVFGKIVGRRRLVCLNVVSISLSDSEAHKIGESGGGVYFDWAPDSESYQKKIRSLPIEFVDS